jgi:hypothetical protein
MSFGENVKNSLKILSFNEKATVDISNNEKATGYGFLTLILACVAITISYLNPIGLISIPFYIIGFIIFYSIYHFIAKFILGGKATGTQYFRALSNASIIYWFTFIPFIGQILQIIAGIYLIILDIFILNKVHKLSWAKAVILGLLPIILAAIIMLIVGMSYFGIMTPDKFLPPARVN